MSVGAAPSFDDVADALATLGDSRERDGEATLARAAQAYVTRAQDDDETALFDAAARGESGVWEDIAATFPMARRTAGLDVSARFGAIPARLAPLARLLVARESELALDDADHDLALVAEGVDLEDRNGPEPGRWSMPNGRSLGDEAR